MSEKIEPDKQLKQALVKEDIVKCELAHLQPDFYKTVTEYGNTLTGEEKEEYEKLLRNLVLKRINKVLPRVVVPDKDMKEKLAKEEVKFFDETAECLKKFLKSTTKKEELF